MNAMIRALKGTLAVLALAGLGWLLRWVTAGSITGLRTYDLDSLTVLAVGTIAWIAYVWLALAVVLTVLEQIPGVVGALAGAVAGRITTKTARALLRSGLGVAAVTPLTVGVAHAAPTDSAHVRHVDQTNPQSATAAGSTLKISGTPQQNTKNYRTTEAPSRLEISGTTPQQSAHDYRSTEAASTLDIGGTPPRQNAGDYRATEAASTLEVGGTPRQESTDRDNYRATEAASTLEIGGTPQDAAKRGDHRSTEAASTLGIAGTATNARRTGNSAAQHHTTDNYRATEPASTLPISQSTTDPTPAKPTPTTGTPTPTTSAKPTDPATSGKPTHPTTTGRPTHPTTSGRPTRMGVPDRPTDGAPTRYTDLHPTVPVSVVVREGDSLWSIAARELGPTATNEAVTARWHDWYAANRHVIGNKPDLILPGQVLRTPPAPHGDHLPPHPQEQ